MPPKSQPRFVKITDPNFDPQLLKKIALDERIQEQNQFESNYGSSVADTLNSRTFRPIIDEVQKGNNDINRLKVIQASNLLLDNIAPDVIKDALKESDEFIDNVSKLAPQQQPQQAPPQTSPPQTSPPQQQPNLTPTISDILQKYSDLDRFFYKSSGKRYDRTKVSMLYSGIDNNGEPILELNKTPLKLEEDSTTAGSTTSPPSYVVSVGSVSVPLTEELIDLLISKTPTQSSIASGSMKDYVQLLRAANVKSPTGTKSTILDLQKQYGLGLEPPSKITTMSMNGSFGNCVVDVEMMKNGVLQVSKGKEVLMKLPLTNGLSYLLKSGGATKKSAGRRYTKEDVQMYSKLASLCRVKPSVLSNKHKLLQDESNVFFYKHPKELFDRMDVIQGMMEAGNDSPKIRNEAMNIIDILLRDRLISKADHKRLFDEMK